MKRESDQEFLKLTTLEQRTGTVLRLVPREEREPEAMRGECRALKYGHPSSQPARAGRSGADGRISGFANLTSRQTMTTQRNQLPGEGQLNPPIILNAQDHEKLSMLARAAAKTMPDVAAVLTEELDRAHVLAKGQYSERTVCMGCEVDFRDETTGKVQTVRLVYPGEVDISKGRISVLTPVGTALVGLRVGDSITWETRTRDLRRLTVLQVREPQLTWDSGRSTPASQQSISQFGRRALRL